VLLGLCNRYAKLKNSYKWPFLTVWSSFIAPIKNSLKNSASLECAINMVKKYKKSFKIEII